MKLAVLSESAADEAAVRILVEAIVERKTEAVDGPSLEARRGWPAVLHVLPAVIKFVHYHTDAVGLVVVADSNGSSPHQIDHADVDESLEGCRLCQLLGAARQTVAALRPAGHRTRPVQVATGLAFPSIEAWYRCGLDPHASEAAWARDHDSGVHAREHIKALKREVYGTDRPHLSLAIDCAVREARRVSQDISSLEEHFPTGFGLLARQIRAW